MRFLKPCIDSILCQTFPDYELILVDDGSTDGSSFICDEYKKEDNRILVTHQVNKGVSAARNVGLDYARGKYVIFVDSDDYLEPTFLKTIFKEIDGFDILFWGNAYHYEDGNVVFHMPNASVAIERTAFEQNIMNLKTNSEGFEYFGYTWGKVFCRDILEKEHVRFIEGLSYREDELFTTDYCKTIVRLKIIPSPIYHYRVLNSGLTAKPKAIEALRTYALALNDQLHYWQHDNLKEYEESRYIKTLFRIFYCEKNFCKKWKTAKTINRLYRRKSHNKMIPQSRIFKLPEPFFSIIVSLMLYFK